MATHLVDCPACACLIEPAEPACPFCGAAQRRTMMPAVLTLGLVLGLAAVSCNEKPDNSMSSTATTMTTAPDTDTTAATDSSTMATTIDDDTVGPVAAYAGPPVTETMSASSPTEITTGTATDTDATDTDATDTDATDTDATDTDATDTINGETTISSGSFYAGAPVSVLPPEDLVGG